MAPYSELSEIGSSICKSILVIGLHPHLLMKLRAELREPICFTVYLAITAGLDLSVSQENTLKEKHFTILDPCGEAPKNHVGYPYFLSESELAKRASTPASSSSP